MEYCLDMNYFTLISSLRIFSLGEAAMCVYICLGSQLMSVYTEYRATAAMSGY